MMFNCLRPLLLGVFLFVLHPIAEAQCNDYDLMLLCDSADMVDIAVSAAALQCAFNPQPEACFSANAVLTLPTMSSGCISCFASEASCALSNCATVCAFGTATDCDACVTSNCLDSFESCAGIVDLDEDTHNNICDCDDNNPLQYPGAPGTNEGIDNNCNGLMEASEVDPNPVVCPGDLNGDNMVGAADLVSFLGHFGCIIECGEEDFDNDGLVGVADLVYLLGFIGLFC